MPAGAPPPKARGAGEIFFKMGPPRGPGEIALSIFLYNSRLSTLENIRALLGPRKVLCVVVVTTSAYGNGDGSAPPATSPAVCDISTISKVLRLRSGWTMLSTIFLNFLKSTALG